MTTKKTKYKIQPDTYVGNSRTFIITCKYYSHCRKNYHDNSEYIALYLYLKKKENNNDKSDSNIDNRGRDNRDNKDNRGENNKNNNNNLPKNELKPIDIKAIIAFSFITYIE